MLRRPRLVALLNATGLPVSRLHVLFSSFRGDVRYKLTHNGQVCFLQAVLNDSFDFTARRIRITDADTLEWGQFAWREAEDRPIMLGTFLLNREGFMGADGIDFVVHIPYAISLTDDNYNMIHSLLRYYKLAGKRYIIQLTVNS